MVKEVLLSGHGLGLGLDDLLGSACFGDGGDDPVGLPGGFGQMDLGPRGFSLGLEGLKKLFQVGQGLVFAPGDLQRRASKSTPAKARARPSG